MIEHTISPIVDRLIYSNEVWRMIRYELYTTLFKPFFQILGIKYDLKPVSSDYVLQNSMSSLIRALETGRILYANGQFTGKFNAEITYELKKLGAIFSVQQKSFKLPIQSIPNDVMAAISIGSADWQKKIDEMQKKLDELRMNPIKDINFIPYVDAIVLDLNKQSSRTLPSDLEIPMELNPVMAENLKKNYSENLNLSIKQWYDESILKLRSQVEANVKQGFRADKLARSIKAEYGVTDRKAKFLAQQETSLLVSKYREERYTDAGITSYVWSTSHDERVRPDHRKLDGHVFRFDQPPITNSRTGDTNNPGEDYGCRCVAIPRLRTKATT